MRQGLSWTAALQALTMIKGAKDASPTHDGRLGEALGRVDTGDR